MDIKDDTLPTINRNDLTMAEKYVWTYLNLFITDGMICNHREIIPRLNSSRQTLLTFCLLDNSMRCGCSNYSDPGEPWSVKGGFLQLIYDGYGEYVFEKPFSGTIKTWGCKKTSRIIEKARSIYEKHKDKVGKVKTLKELSYLCSEITDFETLDYKYIMISVEEAEKVREYIKNNINEFAIIDESNSQVSYVYKDIKEMEDRARMVEEMEAGIK